MMDTMVDPNGDVKQKKRVHKKKPQNTECNKAYTRKETQSITTQRLQEGIILSEVLGPPVSRKRRNRVGRIR